MARGANLIRIVNVRVSDAFAAKLKAKMRRQGHPSDVHRDLLEAYVDDRILITPESERKTS